MSPDPPREDSGDDENRIRRFSGEFMEGMINDEEFFIVPDAPYELDMDVESDYSDSEDEGATGERVRNHSSARTLPNIVTLEGEEQEFLFQEGQSRGRYRLLIPFPNSTAAASENVADATTTSDSSNNDTRNVTSGVNQNIGSGQEEVGDSNANADNESNSGTASSGPSSHLTKEDKPSSSSPLEGDESKREIEMTDEKVEKIKEVMKNITLPSSSIPKWASEIDEESWRKKLNESISSSGRLANKTDKTQRTEAQGQT